ncbi:isoprenylcysteine carboxylmethyltransferase family protein [uncultured Paludibaculum sp.]|uniref:methyltransferase family protein n=1 Tax=uncultured Paludibaculum sp. TaxID=1765020 RepID=UPI002AAB80A7|nr:isoprenylcysteine carboxylmethyltransferase family protein [uncultured Paludibaculum sp.]
MVSEQESTPQAARTGNPLQGALVKYCVMALVEFSILRFVSGRGDWYRAWLYVVLKLAAQMVVGRMILRSNPDLLVERSRMQKGTKSWDKLLAVLVALVGPMSMWIVAALEARWIWPLRVDVGYSTAGFAVCLLGILLTAWAMISNRFFAATVRIQADRGQVVVDQGPYRYVRHPGYTGALAFTLASPFALGSWYALIPAVFTFVVLAVRTALEDRTLKAELAGYAEYANRVRSRLIPWVW